LVIPFVVRRALPLLRESPDKRPPALEEILC
jgi:hypothetical protein